MALSDYTKGVGAGRGLGKYLPTKEPETPVEKLESQGYEMPEKGWKVFGKKFLSTLGSVLDVLRTGEYAVGGILAGKSPITGIKERISPSEVLMKDREEERKLWSWEGLRGLATDVLLDPTTYLTFGTAGAMKIATKGGMVPIKKSGQRLMRKMIEKGASEGAAKRAMARVLQEGGEEAAEKYVGKRGLKFMGQVFMPAEHFQKIGKVVKKLPGAAAASKVGNGFAKAFVPFREIDKMPAKVGGKGRFTDFLYKPFERKTLDDIFKEIDEIKKQAKKAYKEHGVEVGEEMGYRVETKELTGDEFLDNIIKAYEKDRKAMLEIERATGKKVGEIKGYLRHYLTPEGRKFLEEEGAKGFYSALPKPLKAKLSAAKPRKLGGTIRDINKHFKDEFGVDNFFEPDLFKAWALRKAEHIKYINTHKFLEATKARFGKRIDKMEGTWLNGIKHVESSNPQLKGWVLPKPIVKHLDKALEVMTTENMMKKFVSYYDKGLAIWKKNVTGMFPAFHTRNFLGGTFNNWLAGVKAVDNAEAWRILQGSDKAIKTKIGTEYSGKQILDLAGKYGVRGQPGMMDVYRSVQKEVEEIAASGVKKAGLKASKAPRFAMEFVEDRLRLPLFINRLKKGYSPAEAAKDVFKFHFDYLPKTGLAPFEREWMRRIMPFYVWTRNNIPLQIEQIMKQPGKYAGLEKFRKAFMGEEGEEEMKWLPEWMREMFIAKIPGLKDDMGRTLWMQLDLPLEDINKLPFTASGVREIASLLTPFLKFPIEKYMNRNFYFGGDIWNSDVPREMQTRKAIEQLKVLPKPIKKYLNFREVKYRDWRYPDEKRFITRYEMDARKLHIIQSFIGRYYSTLKGVFDEEIPSEWRASRFVGGVPVRPIDLSEEKEMREFEQEQQAQATLLWLKRHDIIPYESEKKSRGLRKYLK